jgi:hypothetical protein
VGHHFNVLAGGAMTDYGILIQETDMSTRYMFGGAALGPNNERSISIASQDYAIIGNNKLKTIEDQYSMTLHHSARFRVEENEFSGVITQLRRGVGPVVWNSQTQYDELYRNTISGDIGTGIGAAGRNFPGWSPAWSGVRTIEE